MITVVLNIFYPVFLKKQNFATSGSRKSRIFVRGNTIPLKPGIIDLNFFEWIRHLKKS